MGSTWSLSWLTGRHWPTGPAASASDRVGVSRMPAVMSLAQAIEGVASSMLTRASSAQTPVPVEVDEGGARALLYHRQWLLTPVIPKAARL